MVKVPKVTQQKPNPQVKTMPQSNEKEGEDLFKPQMKGYCKLNMRSITFNLEAAVSRLEKNSSKSLQVKSFSRIRFVNWQSKTTWCNDCTPTPHIRKLFCHDQSDQCNGQFECEDDEHLPDILLSSICHTHNRCIFCKTPGIRGRG